MSFTTANTSVDSIDPAKGELGQGQVRRNFTTSNYFESKELQDDKISPVENPSHQNIPPRDPHDVSPANDAPATIVSRRPSTSTSTSQSSTNLLNLDNPLALFETTEELDEVISQFASNHGLKELLVPLKHAARMERDEMEAYRDPEIPDEEKTASEKERDAPFSKQSTSLRGAVLVVGTLSGMCQGWAQSVLNGSGICPKEKSPLGVLTLSYRACHSRRLQSPYSSR